MLAAKNRVNRDEGIGMERFCPKPKKAVGGWKAKTLETQVSVVGVRFSRDPCKGTGKLRKHLEVWSVFLFLLIVVASPLAIFPMLLWLLLFPFVIVSVFCSCRESVRLGSIRFLGRFCP